MKLYFPRENEAIKHDLVKFKVQCLKVFCYHGNTSTILLFDSIFRTASEVSSKLYFGKSQRSYGFLITEELTFLASKFWNTLLSLLKSNHLFIHYLFQFTFIAGPHPVVTPENATISVLENGLPNQKLVDFVAATNMDSNRISLKAIFKVKIIPGKPNKH